MSSTLKQQYFRQHLERGVKEIFASQLAIATSRLAHTASAGVGAKRGLNAGRAPELIQALQNPQYVISDSGAGVEMRVPIPLSLRFLDMKHLGNMRIYNRQVWGILYSATLQDVKYEWRDYINSRIRTAFAQKKV